MERQRQGNLSQTDQTLDKSWEDLLNRRYAWKKKLKESQNNEPPQLMTFQRKKFPTVQKQVGLNKQSNFSPTYSHKLTASQSSCNNKVTTFSALENVKTSSCPANCDFLSLVEMTEREKLSFAQLKVPRSDFFLQVSFQFHLDNYEDLKESCEKHCFAEDKVHLELAFVNKNDYKLNLGFLKNQDMEENFNVEATAKSPNNELFKIPINLLQRWGNLYKTADLDSESDSESEYEEEDDPDSPYYLDTTFPIEPNISCKKMLEDFTNFAFNVNEKFIQTYNEKYGFNDVVLQEEVVRLNKTKEVVYILESSWSKDGVRNGFYRCLDPDGKEVLAVGRYFENEKCGVCWKKMEGRSFVVCSHENNNNEVNFLTLFYHCFKHEETLINLIWN